MTKPTQAHGAMPELLPCKFCEHSMMHMRSVGQMQQAHCSGCGAAGPLFTDAGPAIAAWNRRAAIQQAAGAVPKPRRVTIADARDYLNTNDKAFWVTGWNECVESMLGTNDLRSEISPLLNPPLGREAGKEGGSDHLVPCAGGGVTQPTPVPKYDPRMRFLEKEKGVLDLRIEGLSMRQIKDIFEQEYGALMWSEGSAYPCNKVRLQFIRADLSPRPDAPTSQINPVSAPREDGHG